VISAAIDDAGAAHTGVQRRAHGRHFGQHAAERSGRFERIDEMQGSLVERTVPTNPRSISRPSTSPWASGSVTRSRWSSPERPTAPPPWRCTSCTRSLLTVPTRTIPAAQLATRRSMRTGSPADLPRFDSRLGVMENTTRHVPDPSAFLHAGIWPRSASRSCWSGACRSRPIQGRRRGRPGSAERPSGADGGPGRRGLPGPPAHASAARRHRPRRDLGLGPGDSHAGPGRDLLAEPLGCLGLRCAQRPAGDAPKVR